MSSKIHVAHVISTMDYGGVEAMALLLLKRLPLDIFEHHIIYVGRQAPQRYNEFNHLTTSFNHIPYNLLNCISFSRRVYRVLIECDIQVVLCHNFGHHPFIGLASYWARIKRAYSIVASNPCVTPLIRFKNILKGLLGRLFCKLEIAVSDQVGDELEFGLFIPRKRIRIIYNCALTDEFSKRAEIIRQSKTLSIPTLLMIARLDDAKDHETLLHALAILIKAGRPLQLQLAGDGPRKAFLIDLCKQLNIRSHVNILGSRSDTPELLGMSDIFILSTNTEGFPLVLIEAMSAGTPIICSDLPICREILDNGRFGLLFPVGDANALAECICRQLDNYYLAKSIASAGRIHAHNNYSPEKTVQQYKSLLLGELDSL